MFSFCSLDIYVKIIANSSVWSIADDLDALIVVDILFVNSDDDSEQLQIANIQFNNLDIIGEIFLSVRVYREKDITGISWVFYSQSGDNCGTYWFL